MIGKDRLFATIMYNASLNPAEADNFLAIAPTPL